MGALTRSATEVGSEITRKAREKFEQSFYDATDPALPDEERRRQAKAARRLHYSRLGQKSALARKRLATAQAEVDRIQTELDSAVYGDVQAS